MLHKSWEVAMRPVRRAISGIMEGLHALGLSVRSLRKAGYVLEALTLSHF
jgi:biotin operon repressor